MTTRARSLAAALIILPAVSLAACSSVPAPASGSSPAPAGVSASSSRAPASPADAAAAKACAELSAWQKKHGDSVAPPQEVFNGLINAPQPLSGDFTAWDLVVGTGQPDEKADLLKVWTDCAKVQAAALGG